MVGVQDGGQALHRAEHDRLREERGGRGEYEQRVTHSRADRGPERHLARAPTWV